MRTQGKTKAPRASTFDDTRRLTRAQETALFAFLMIVLLALIIYGLSA